MKELIQFLKNLEGEFTVLLMGMTVLFGGTIFINWIFWMIFS